jgi:hypothetical protein
MIAWMDAWKHGWMDVMKGCMLAWMHGCMDCWLANIKKNTWKVAGAVHVNACEYALCLYVCRCVLLCALPSTSESNITSGSGTSVATTAPTFGTKLQMTCGTSDIDTKIC